MSRPHTNKPYQLLKISGYVIRISDIRGFITGDGHRSLYLKNGMTMKLSESESRFVQKALNGEAKRIVKVAGATGTL